MECFQTFQKYWIHSNVFWIKNWLSQLHYSDRFYNKHVKTTAWIERKHCWCHAHKRTTLYHTLYVCLLSTIRTLHVILFETHCRSITMRVWMKLRGKSNQISVDLRTWIQINEPSNVKETFFIAPTGFHLTKAITLYVIIPNEIENYQTII